MSPHADGHYLTQLGLETVASTVTRVNLSLPKWNSKFVSRI